MNSEDHDTLISLKTEMGYVHKNLNALCKQINHYMEANKKDHDAINLLITNQMAECPKTFLLARTFYWVTAFLILGLLTIGASTVSNQVNINTLTVKEAQNDNQLPRSEITEDTAKDSKPRP